MSKISQQTVQNLAQLSNLNLSKQEIAAYQQQLTVILDLIEQLQSVDVSQLTTTEQVSQLSNATRDDVIDPNLSLDIAQFKQPSVDTLDRQFKLPLVN